MLVAADHGVSCAAFNKDLYHLEYYMLKLHIYFSIQFNKLWYIMILHYIISSDNALSLTQPMSIQATSGPKPASQEYIKWGYCHFVFHFTK